MINLAPFTRSNRAPLGLARFIDSRIRKIVEHAAAQYPGACLGSLLREAESILTEWLAIGPHSSHRCPRFGRWDAFAAVLTLWRRLRRAKRSGKSAEACANSIFPRSLLRALTDGVNAYARRLGQNMRRLFDPDSYQPVMLPLSVIVKLKTGVAVAPLPAKQRQIVRVYA